MLRRLFLAGFCAVLAFAEAHPAALAQGPAAHAVSFELYIDEMFDRPVGGKSEFSVAFRDPLTRKLNPTLKVLEGESVTIKVVNRTRVPRSFAIMGVAGASSSTLVAAGATTSVRFKAPARGNYIYHDPTQASLAEPRSLFGDLIVGAMPH